MKYQETREIGLLYRGSVPYTFKARLENVVCYTEDFVISRFQCTGRRGHKLLLESIAQIAIIMFVLAHPPSTNRPHRPLSENVTKIILPLERNYFLPSLVVPLFCKGHNTAKVREGDD